tara:strand:- start:320 stop:964 length:645 start_codon:yes stop_codon:yes gene_type:complete
MKFDELVMLAESMADYIPQWIANEYGGKGGWKKALRDGTIEAGLTLGTAGFGHLAKLRHLKHLKNTPSAVKRLPTRKMRTVNPLTSQGRSNLLKGGGVSLGVGLAADAPNIYHSLKAPHTQSNVNRVDVLPPQSAPSRAQMMRPLPKPQSIGASITNNVTFQKLRRDWLAGDPGATNEVMKIMNLKPGETVGQFPANHVQQLIMRDFPLPNAPK